VTVDGARETKDRLLEAASALFAERGYHGTKLRDVAARARVNLAAGHYHFGSKKALYLAVLRAQFAAIRGLLQAHGAVRTKGELRRLTRPALQDLLRTRVRVMLDILLGPPPGLHGTLMQREMCDPSEAMPVIVDEFIRPVMSEMAEIIRHLTPSLDAETAERCAMSVAGQAYFYRAVMPAMLVLFDTPAYRRGFIRDLAEHITDFSVGGMEHVAGARPRRRHA
jgi:AcrR family transcriptional regulator